MGLHSGVIRLPDVLESYKARLLRHNSKEAQQIVIFIEKAAMSEEIGTDPEGLEELISLVLHRVHSVEKHVLFDSSAWIAMSFVSESLFDLPSTNVAIASPSEFALGLRQICQFIQVEACGYHGVPDFETGHQAIDTCGVQLYTGPKVTHQGYQVQCPAASLVYLDREPKARYTAVLSGKSCRLKITAKRLLELNVAGVSRARLLRPKEVQLSIKFVKITWDTTAKADDKYDNKLFNSVLFGEYGDGAVIWLLSHVFARRLDDVKTRS